MCGIAGRFAPGGTLPASPGLLARMTGALAHRGPDEESYHRAAALELGVRRLAIMDVAGGHQPIFNEDRTLVLACNGEIYNHAALRRELSAQGHRFAARVDVESIVHLYEQYGTACVERLEGQFAFALYDTRRQTLLLARDPVGIAPLFYAWHDGALLFASEIKALLQHPDLSRRVDLTGLDQVLTFPGPVSPRTLFADIASLPPGHCAEVSSAGWRSRCYWDLDYPRQADLNPAAPDFDALESCLQQAVDARLEADLPVGFYLSGGLDSSLIGALIQRHDRLPGNGGATTARREAFSIGFDDPRLDEGSSQALAASWLEARHHSVNFAAGDVAARLRQAVACAEAPLKESYNTCSLSLSELVRRHGLKVVLTGEGADELFAGYVGYRFAGRRAAPAGEEVEEEMDRALRRRLWGDDNLFYEKNYAALRDLKTALYAPGLARRLAEFDCTRENPVDRDKLRGRHPVHQRSYLDFKLRLADHLLADHGDRVAYAHSVEARYPFLDRGVIDWARSASPDWMVREGVEKYPLRRVARRLLPPAIAGRAKFAFVAASAASLVGAGLDWVEELLCERRLRDAGYFNPAAVARLRQEYRRPGFALNTTFDLDLLMFVLTFEILRDTFAIPAL